MLTCRGGYSTIHERLHAGVLGLHREIFLKYDRHKVGKFAGDKSTALTTVYYSKRWVGRYSTTQHEQNADFTGLICTLISQLVSIALV